ncbi:MAG: PDZ domain-containing protein [Bacteroidales bacterium]|jgi:tricorn protease
MKKLFLIALTLSVFQFSFAQISAKLFRYMDVSDNQITFVYGGDIWVMPKSGGTAVQITHSPGEESWPRFCPDGKSIAYTASYNGNADVYVIPTLGGLPTRVTYQSGGDQLVDWHPDGKKLLFTSARESGRGAMTNLYLVDASGGFPEKLKVPYAILASFSPDGSKLAYVTRITENYPFKRYRGGLASDVIVFDLKNNTAENITKNDAIDGKPAWVGDKIYLLSDRDENMRLNIWMYDTKTKESVQVTKIKDYDITHMAAGKTDIVFEAGGVLYMLDLASQKYQPVEVQVISDLSLEMPHSVNVSSRISNMSAAPGGKRIIFEARGELFNVPVTEGYVINLTRSSGAFDRDPAWSPDGKTIAYWSDRDGEYEIWLQPVTDKEQLKKLTKRGKGYGYTLHWSPDSKKIAFIDETNNVYVTDAESGKTETIGNTLYTVGHGGAPGYTISWSPDSKWITFTQSLNNNNNAIFLYEMESGKSRQVTSGFYNDSDPVFTTDGKYLVYLTNRNMSAEYSDLGDGTWIYPNSTEIAALGLTKDAPSLLSPKNDEQEEKKPAKDTSKVVVKVDFENIESRAVILPPKPGNIRGVETFEGKIVYMRSPNTGSDDRSSSLIVYDLTSREEKPVISEVNRVVVTADGKSLLVSSSGKYGIIQPAAGQKIEKPIPTGDLVMDLVPREEWRQIFTDTWRRHRDFFYDPNMQGVDWKEMRIRYGALIDFARTRWDVNYIQSQLVSELAAGHTYASGGDLEAVRPIPTGFLGIDWELNDGRYRIKRIITPAAWDTDARSPFDQSGVKAGVGDYILAVNGISLDPKMDPYAPFEGLSGKTVALTVSKTGKTDDSQKIVVKCLTPGEESNLRYLEWIENNRKMVEKLSDGKLGYIYMSNTSAQGQLELVKMFYGQLDKDGFIIDERFNGGGALADRFLELLKRPVVYNLHWRHGMDHTQPIKTNNGPKGMLINGWAGSGGDGLPWAFQELKAGPIVGERTLGILVGPATGHSLIDGGSITVPDARLYDNDGHWFWEGIGVTPDFPVWDDPNILVQGRDPQIEKVVEEVMKLVKVAPAKMTPAPKLEDRTAKGLYKK